MNLKRVLTSSPGKIILHGEHAVVHGTTALASSLNLRSYLHLVSTPGTVTLSFPDLDLNRSWDCKATEEAFADLVSYRDDGNAFLDEAGFERLKSFAGLTDDITTKNLAVIAFLYLYICIFKSKSLELRGLSALATSNLPTGAGLGSSAAFSASLAAGLLLISETVPLPSDGTNWSKDHRQLINRWAYEGERVIHGNPSGIDNAVSVSGGALRYKSKIFEALDKMPSLKILLVNTKVARSTKVLVAGVKDKLEKYPGVIKPVFDSIEDISQRCQAVLSTLWNEENVGGSGGDDDPADSRDGLYQTMEELIEMNQSFLKILGVSHPSIEHICTVTSEFGIHAKLTGAGGGGCVFAIVRPDFPEEKLSKVMDKLEGFGYESWVTSIGGVGVSYHPDVDDINKRGFFLPANFSNLELTK